MKRIVILSMIVVLAYLQIEAQGHGPLYGLQTPTLPQGNFNFNTSAMSIASNNEQSYMLRYMGMYGLTEDLQVNFTAPTVLQTMENPPRTRGNSNMPANGNVEASVWYRFFSNAFDVGKRFEATAIMGASAPTETGLGHSLHAALSTGYASRTWYGWIGGGYQYYLQSNNQQPGDLPYVSLVAGYRPDIFKEDYPKPDWRIFVESLAEFPGSGNSERPFTASNRRGRKILVGPSFLGLYGPWGISIGALFPVEQNNTEDFQKERYRLALNVSYWL